MERLNKILWGMFSTLICIFYNIEAKALTCTYSIAESQDLGAYTGGAYNFSFQTCSAATLCSDAFSSDCAGRFGALYQSLSANVAVTETSVCSAGYYISKCDMLSQNPTTEQLYNFCKGGFDCDKCPNDGTNSYPGIVGESKRLSFSIGGQSIMFNGNNFWVCGAVHPFTGASTGRLTMYSIKPTCTGAYDNRYSVYDCAVKGGANGTGTYIFLNSCYYGG